jgi:hypothetical protein
MNENVGQFYVYVYIDPRNLEPFYYGKGCGARQFSHLSDVKESEKTARIRQIEKDGQEPIVRVIATGLTEEQAFLVEKTLIWHTHGLTNIATGHFSVGDGKHRCWEDNVKYCYLGAGQAKAFRDAIGGLHNGDTVVARLNGAGYVGIGRVMSEATPARDFRVPKFAGALCGPGRLLIDMGLQVAIDDNLDDDIRCEYMVAVKWIKTVGRDKAFWKKNAGLFAQRGTTRASLANQIRTIDFVQRCFGVNFEELANGSEEESTEVECEDLS